VLVHLQPIQEALCVDDVLMHFNFSSLCILSLCPDFHGLLVCTDKDTNLFFSMGFCAYHILFRDCVSLSFFVPMYCIRLKY